MPNKDYTHIIIVSDRSGSMSGRGLPEYEQGINGLISEQSNVDGKCTVTFVEFDNQIDMIHDFKDISHVGHYTISPRGATKLNDAIGQAISSTEQRINNMPEIERPGVVSLLISTDGYENASQEYSSESVKAMIEEKKSKNNWIVTFIGGGIKAEESAANFGIRQDSAVSFNKVKAESVYTSYSGKLKRARGMASSGAPVENVIGTMDFNTDEKKDFA